MTISSGSIVDAATFISSPTLETTTSVTACLCKNAHWLFDEGLWTIADDYTVKVARGSFAEYSPDQKPLSDYRGQRLRLPSDPALCTPLIPFTLAGIEERDSWDAINARTRSRPTRNGDGADQRGSQAAASSSPLL